MSRHKVVENESRKSWKHKNKDNKQDEDGIDEKFEWIVEFHCLFKEKLGKLEIEWQNFNLQNTKKKQTNKIKMEKIKLHKENITYQIENLYNLQQMA